MMKRCLLALSCAVLILSTSCAFYRAPVMPPSGFLFSSVEAPMDTDVDATVVATRSGSASAMCVLGMFSFGDASIAEAAQDGGLSKIHHLDYHYLNVFIGLFQSFTTKAYGE